MRDLDDVIQLAKMIVSNLSTSRLFPIDPPLPPLTVARRVPSGE